MSTGPVLMSSWVIRRLPGSHITKTPSEASRGSRTLRGEPRLPIATTPSARFGGKRDRPIRTGLYLEKARPLRACITTGRGTMTQRADGLSVQILRAADTPTQATARRTSSTRAGCCLHRSIMDAAPLAGAVPARRAAQRLCLEDANGDGSAEGMDRVAALPSGG